MKKLAMLSPVAALFWSCPALAASYEVGPSANLGQEIAKLKAGDELVLQGGTYTLTSKLTIGVSGTAALPIVIRSKDGETAHITRDASQNVINVENAQYVVLRRLEVSKGSHGIRMLASSFITVEDCHIHDTADVALSANVGGSKYQGLIIRRNHIHHTNGTGEGMYLGCNNDGCQMFDSLIEGNYVHHTNQSTVSQGDGIEIKQGSYNNIVRDNVIHDTNYPCILVYGTAGKAVNLLERNAMWNCGDHGIQAEADAIIRNNLLLGVGGVLPGQLGVVRRQGFLGVLAVAGDAGLFLVELGAIEGEGVAGGESQSGQDGEEVYSFHVNLQIREKAGSMLPRSPLNGLAEEKLI